MTIDPTERGLERRIRAALAGLPCEPDTAASTGGALEDAHAVLADTPDTHATLKIVQSRRGIRVLVRLGASLYGPLGCRRSAFSVAASRCMCPYPVEQLGAGVTLDNPATYFKQLLRRG